MRYEIFKEESFDIDEEGINKIIDRFIDIYKIDKEIYLSIAFVDKKTITKINNQYRKINKPTDVLSFRDEDVGLDMPYKKNINNLLGEILICFPVAQQQAKENNITTKKEIDKLLVHGLMHLMGYDHETNEQIKKMSKEESKILGEAGLIQT